MFCLMLQFHWQSDAKSDILGTLHNSSIIKDVNRSNLNVYVENYIYSKKIKYLNILELDDVCNNGINVYKAIQSVFLS
jgi:hypothetical protein